MNLVLSFLVFALFVNISSSIVVPTASGPVRGVLESSHGGQSFYSFQGIPYARPFDGFLRFRVSFCKSFSFLRRSLN